MAIYIETTHWLQGWRIIEYTDELAEGGGRIRAHVFVSISL